MFDYKQSKYYYKNENESPVDKIEKSTDKIEPLAHKKESCGCKIEPCGCKIEPCDHKKEPCDHKKEPCDHKKEPIPEKIEPCEKPHPAPKPCKPQQSQTHVHEFAGSTKLAELKYDPHNHRFAGVTSELIPKDGGHVHSILVNTDFFDHHHEFGIITGLPIPVGETKEGKHIHYVEGITTMDDDHTHKFEFTTLINSPLV